MREDYKCTNKEILSEIFGTWQNFKEKGKDFAEGFGRAAAFVLACQYALPTSLRKIDDIISEKEFGDLSYSFLGGTLGGGITSCMGIPYSNELFNTYPQLRAIQLTTNAISVVYETGRYLVKNAKERLEQKKSENLESIMSD